MKSLKTIALLIFFLTSLHTGNNHLNSQEALLGASIQVNTTHDELNNDGDCSLREAIQAANTDSAVDDCLSGAGEDTILLPAGVYSMSLPGADENLNQAFDWDITGSLTLSGSGPGVTILDGGLLDRVIDIHSTSTVRLEHLSIIHGRAWDSAPGQHAGGVRISTLASVTILDCWIYENEAGNSNADVGMNGKDGGSGGGIYNEGHLVIDHSWIHSNQAGDGGEGAIEGGNGGSGGGIYNSGVLTITHSTIQDNLSGQGNKFIAPGENGKGAGIFTSGETLIDFSTISGNHLAHFGSGIYSSNPNTLTIKHSTISNNYDADYGGGVFLQNGSLNLKNSTISSNAAQTGAGVYLDAGVVAFLSLTIANNTASQDGGGIDNNAATALIKNSILAGNIDQNPGGADTPDCAGELSSLDYNLVQSTSGCTLTGITAHNLVGVSPLLGDLSQNGGPTLTHALLTLSPAIDSGVCAGLADDQRGSPRPADISASINLVDGCDRGAFEVQNLVFLALLFR